MSADYTLSVAGPAARALPSTRPEAVAAAVIEFITGPLVRAPHRVGKPLHAELAGTHVARRGTYRVLYDIDDVNGVVTVLHVDHRWDVYRRR